MRAYATYDPRKGTHVAGGNGGDHPYQEIPYGDGPGPRGPIPEVPQHYAQVPPPPQRQGMLAPGPLSLLFCLVLWRRIGSLSTRAGTVNAHGCQTLMVGVPRLMPAVLWSLSTTIFTQFFFSILCFSDVRYPLQLVARCLDRRRIFLHMQLSTFWEWERRWFSNWNKYFANIC